MARIYLMTETDKPITTSSYNPSGEDAVNGQAINDALDGLDVNDTAENGKYVSAVSEVNGKISVSRESFPEHTSGDIEKPSSAEEGQVLTFDGENWVAQDVQNNNEPIALVPEMTSNTEPEGETSASSKFYDTTDAWKAFNGTNGHTSDGWLSASGDVVNAWIQYKFPSKVNVTSVYIENRNDTNARACKEFKIQGSNDGIEYDNLQTFTNKEYAGNKNSSYSFNNNNSYLYYRLLVIQGYDSNYVGFGKIQFYSSKIANEYIAGDGINISEDNVISVKPNEEIINTDKLLVNDNTLLQTDSENNIIFIPTTSKQLSTLKPFKPGSDSWDITLCFKATQINSMNTLIGVNSGYKEPIVMEFQIINNKNYIRAYVADSYNNYKVVLTNTTPIETYEKYWISLRYSENVYSLWLSEDGIIYNEEQSVTSDMIVSNKDYDNLYLGSCYNNTSSYLFYGTIYFSNSFIKINDKLWFGVEKELKNNLINDSTSSLATTYSSNKIESSLSDISDSINDKISKPTSASKGQVLTYNGENWIAETYSGGTSVSSEDATYTAGEGIQISEDNKISTRFRFVDITKESYLSLTTAQQEDPEIYYCVIDAEDEDDLSSNQHVPKVNIDIEILENTLSKAIKVEEDK